MKPIKDYKPMGIESWDQSGQGNNIRHLFTPIEIEIWDKAFQYQDKRNDIGHIEHVVYFAFKLLEYIPAERAIVIPAAILHDTGWAKLFEKGILKEFNPFSEEYKRSNPMYRKLHQEDGVEIARRILEDVHYTQRYRQLILKIIGEHDTREDFSTIEARIVGDADRLWQITLAHMKRYYNNYTPEQIAREFRAKIEQPGFLLLGESRHIARLELEQTLKHLKEV